MKTKTNKNNKNEHQLHLKYLGIDTYKKAIIFMHRDCVVCQSEGFEIPSRIRVTLGNKSILATLNIIEGSLLKCNEATLCNYAWNLLEAKEGDTIQLSHPKPLQSLSFVRSKVYGHDLKTFEINQIIEDISSDRYSDLNVATFLTACAGGRLNENEIIDLTKAMINMGECLTWPNDIIVDKHCVGGLPGNRTTLIVVPIVTAFGMTMPKTSSRAITSPAGTADTMEVLAPVNLTIKQIKQIVEKEQGCIVWGGAVNLSPADDILIQVERVMDIDSEGQLIASVLSKKISAGSTHIAIDMPIGPTAKIRSLTIADSLKKLFLQIGNALGINLKVFLTDGSQPVGRGIGPALEAKDVLAVLQNAPLAPLDLRDRALTIASHIIEFNPTIKPGEGRQIAERILNDGSAWKKFQAICQAQGGIREPTTAAYTKTITAPCRGRINSIDNRQLAHLAKLAGAPRNKAAGVLLHTPLDTLVENDQPLYTIHSESKGALEYAYSLLEQKPDIIQVESYE